jgi:hypothetical protein
MNKTNLTKLLDVHGIFFLWQQIEDGSIEVLEIVKLPFVQLIQGSKKIISDHFPTQFEKKTGKHTVL